MAVGVLNENNLADQIARVCFEHYSQLGQRGKPLLSKEWTLLAAIVQSIDNRLSVVAMATGTKCIGHTAMSAKGDVVNDSHAEVLARRCFLRYLYDQVETAKEKGSSVIFSGFSADGKCALRTNVDFILFTSHVPCGDASIIPKTLSGKKRKRTFSESDEPKIKIANIENKEAVSENCFTDLLSNTTVSRMPISTTEEMIVSDTECDLSDNIGDVVDIYRTGAKCVGDKRDSKLPGLGYHVLGAVRTKPGRGDATLSVSCSDKIARWIAVGLQGACLSLLIEGPVLLKHIVVAAGGPYSHLALHRAVISRIQPTHLPELAQSTLEFVHSRYKADVGAKPSPTSIMWTKLSNKALEIGVEGRKQGTTKKTLDKGRLMICKFELFKKFISLTGDEYAWMCYIDVKDTAEEYQKNWTRCREKLGTWTDKPRQLMEFRIEA